MKIESKDVTEEFYENHLRTHTHINNLNKGNRAWRKCEKSIVVN